MNLRALFLLPARVSVAVLLAAPLAIVCAYSFLTRGDYGGVEHPWTIESYQRLADPLYLAILGRSLWMSGLSTVLCALFGFPLALFISRAGRRKALYIQLVLLPFWTSFLIRTYAWIFILRDTGLVNSVLIGLHIIKTPLPLLYNEAAVVTGLVYNFLPFFVLPVVATLDRIDPSMLEAAADLGARARSTLWRVIVPLAAPGIGAGAILVFIPCLGAYLTPDLLGGGKSVMLGNLIQNQFTSARDWPFGAASSMVLMLGSALVLAALMRSRAAKEVL